MAGRVGPTTLGDPRGADGARMTGELLNIEQEPLLRDRFEEGNNGRLVIVTIVSGNNHHPLGHDATIYICMYVHRKLVKQFHATRGESNFYRADGCWVYCR